MSTIHFIGGEKGGVGKSVFSRVLAQYFIDHDQAFSGFDADSSHATLTRFYGQFSQAVFLEKFESTDIIIEKAMMEDVQLVVDLPAQSQRFLMKWMEQNAVLEFCATEDVNVVFWFVMDDGRDCANLANAFVKQFAGDLPVVLVKNFGRGTNFAELPAVEDQELKVLDIELPELYSSTMQKVDHNDLDFWFAAEVKDSAMSLMERQRVKTWLKRCYAELDRAFNFMK